LLVTCLDFTTDSASTTNEVNNLNPIIVMKLRDAPVAAPHDRAIQLDGYSRFGKIQLGD